MRHFSLIPAKLFATDSENCFRQFVALKPPSKIYPNEGFMRGGDKLWLSETILADYALERRMSK